MTHFPVKNFVSIEDVVRFCERVKGSDTLRPCPVCLGTGEFDTPSNMGPGVPKCPVCAGTGFVDLASICCCGGPAILFKDDVIYCGRDTCLTVLKHRKAPTFSCL